MAIREIVQHTDPFIRKKSREVKVIDDKIIELLEYCRDIYNETNGKTNVMLGSVLELWHLHRQNGLNNPSKATLPQMSELLERQALCEMEFLEIDNPFLPLLKSLHFIFNIFFFHIKDLICHAFC